jgi:hypothetical protein
MKTGAPSPASGIFAAKSFHLVDARSVRASTAAWRRGGSVVLEASSDMGNSGGGPATAPISGLRRREVKRIAGVPSPGKRIGYRI